MAGCGWCGCCLLVIQYQVLVFPRLKLSGGGSTTANCWLSIGGQYGETEEIQLPKHTLDITIKVVTYNSCVDTYRVPALDGQHQASIPSVKSQLVNQEMRIFIGYLSPVCVHAVLTCKSCSVYLPKATFGNVVQLGATHGNKGQGCV